MIGSRRVGTVQRNDFWDRHRRIAKRLGQLNRRFVDVDDVVGRCVRKTIDGCSAIEIITEIGNTGRIWSHEPFIASTNHSVCLNFFDAERKGSNRLSSIYYQQRFVFGCFLTDCLEVVK